ncbi:XkdQ/YqbQ family protein [Paenibacillus guangzhouensis]|uniref:XkdQ/YqbQ family protein n=1 Tax=Paenibacillus guangzhouensis TaxID=1473112 RepID=UPI001266D660|nr:hypothetical protein [Paenibacillus guangzhouensis]
MLEVLLDNKDGNVWDLSELVYDATWKTSRIGKPGSFDFSVLNDGNFRMNHGDIVRAKWDGRPLFYGYVFTIGSGQDEQIAVKCYDQIRYLMASDTYVLKNITAAALLKRIANDFGLKSGMIVDTKYIIPTVHEDGQKLMDIICKALDQTVINTGNIYNFYDEFGALALRDARDMMLDLMIGDDSLMIDHSFERSIDQDTYNRIKLVRDNKETGGRDVHIAQDSENIAKWGRLQLYQKVGENQNDAQIRNLLDTLARLKNRPTKKLRIEALGETSVRAGCYVHMQIAHLAIHSPYLIDECSHNFSGEEYTMTLDLKVI